MIKTLNRVGTEGTYLHTMKAGCDKATADIRFNGEKRKVCPLRSGKKTRVLILATVLQRITQHGGCAVA